MLSGPKVRARRDALGLGREAVVKALYVDGVEFSARGLQQLEESVYRDSRLSVGFGLARVLGCDIEDLFYEPEAEEVAS